MMLAKRHFPFCYFTESSAPLQYAANSDKMNCNKSLPQQWNLHNVCTSLVKAMSLYQTVALYLNWVAIHYKQKFPGKVTFTPKKLGSGTYWHATLVTHHI
jgi:hypothetical protein